MIARFEIPYYRLKRFWFESPEQLVKMAFPDYRMMRVWRHPRKEVYKVVVVY